MKRLLVFAAISWAICVAGTAGRAQTFYVSSGSQTIDKVSSTGAVSLFATLPANSQPHGLAFDSSGNLYAANQGTNTISKINSSGTGSLFASLPGTSVPYGLAFDNMGNLYVPNKGADQISKINSAGVVSAFATLPVGSYPEGLAFDGGGNLYAAAYLTSKISKITSAGTASLFATLPVGSGPVGLAFDGSGNLYAADQDTNQISKITPGGVVSTFAFLPGFSPFGLTFDANGNLYVTSQNTSQISKITSGGVVSTFTAGVSQPRFIVAAPTQDVQDYGAVKTESLTQTSTATPTINSFGFTAQARRQSGGSLTSASVSLPAGSTNSSPQALASDGNGNLVFNGGSATQAGIDAKFNNGTYTFNITGGSGSYSGNVALTGNTYPIAPTITNANWSNGALAISPSQSFTLTWNSFSNSGVGDSVSLFDDSGAFQFNVDPNTRLQFIPAGSFAPNTSYKFHLVFSHVVDRNTTSIQGATGTATYQDNTNFTIQTLQPTAPVITSPPAATGTIGQPFTYQLVANGATSLGASSLPPGLTFTANLAAITGTPTVPTGTFSAGLSASNSFGTTNATLTLTIQPSPQTGPVIISSTSATGRVGQSFSFQIITTSGSPASRVSATGLPSGLVIDAVTGLIKGTPTAEGSSPVTLTVTDGNLMTSSVLQLTFTADPTIPVIISPSSAPVTPGQSFSYQIVAPATTDPSDVTTYSYIGILPPGLVFDPTTGMIFGTFTPGLQYNPESPNHITLSGGIVTNVQLFATNSHGTSTIPLNFFLAPTGAVNIATRLVIGTGDNVLIAGFIITGNAPKKVIIRAIGPSLGAFGIGNAVQDTTLELHDGGSTLGKNDDWRESQEDEIITTGLAPTDNRESAIVATLAPGNYTAIVAGKNTSGIAVAEVYDLGTASLDGSSNSKLANIATRGPVLGGDNVMIGGFIVSGQSAKFAIRALGPSLSAFGISGTLQDPTLALKNANGATLIGNDDWQQGDPVEINRLGLAPADPRESALIATLGPGQYTAIVSGKGNATGVALVEVYSLP